MRKSKPKLDKDFSALTTPASSKLKSDFQGAVAEKLDELNHSDQDSTSKIYDDMCAAITHAIDTTLPTAPKRRRHKRKVSERTKALYAKRSNMRGCTQGEFAEATAVKH